MPALNFRRTILNLNGLRVDVHTRGEQISLYFDFGKEADWRVREYKTSAHEIAIAVSHLQDLLALQRASEPSRPLTEQELLTLLPLFLNESEAQVRENADLILAHQARLSELLTRLYFHGNQVILGLAAELAKERREALAEMNRP